MKQKTRKKERKKKKRKIEISVFFKKFSLCSLLAQRRIQQHGEQLFSRPAAGQLSRVPARKE
jgi:hypothetical protein